MFVLSVYGLKKRWEFSVFIHVINEWNKWTRVSTWFLKSMENCGIWFHCFPRWVNISISKSFPMSFCFIPSSLIHFLLLFFFCFLSFLCPSSFPWALILLFLSFSPCIPSLSFLILLPSFLLDYSFPHKL